MATIAELLGDKAQDVRQKAGAPTTLHTPEVCVEAMHYVAECSRLGSAFAAVRQDPQAATS